MQKINLDDMSSRGKLIAEGIIMQQRYHEIVERDDWQPGILKTKVAVHMIETMKQNRLKLDSIEYEGVIAFRDYCEHREFRGDCDNPHCNAYMYPLNWLAWFEYWLRKHPEDEDALYALWCKFGNYPRYHS